MSLPHRTAVPIKLLHDRVLVRGDCPDGERQEGQKMRVAASAVAGRRLQWALVVAVGPNVRTIGAGDHVLFDPEDRSNVSIHGVEHILLREPDVHAVASERHRNANTGLYL